MTFTSKFTPLNGSQLDPQYSIAEVAEIMGVSGNTIRNWIAQGKLRAYRYSARLIRIDESDLLAMREQIAAPTFSNVSGGGEARV